MLEQVTIDKLVHGGQGMGVLPDGRKVFIWNALPNEIVSVRITKKRKDYCEAVAEEIIKPSPERTKPTDEAYLSTSPWQIMDFAAENKYKQQILTETMFREKVSWNKNIPFHTDDIQWHYRNKMEYSFWADDDGLHLALFQRGTYGKQIVLGSSIARAEIDATAAEILRVLNDTGIRGSQLKTLVVRCDQQGESVASLFVKDEAFPKIKALFKCAKGISVIYSTPKSPASVHTKKLHEFGDITLTDKIMGVDITYDVHSFFQVNVPVFEWTAKRIDYFLGGSKKVDLYCGVGTIGLAVGRTKIFVDVDENNCDYAKKNVDGRGEVICASSEQALEYVSADKSLIVDPPRAGLHAKLIDKIKVVKPPSIAYLSCNPSTQARDLALLQEDYKIKAVEGYNFFPRTPHIECLAVMIRK